jgi:hypothetical protein
MHLMLETRCLKVDLADASHPMRRRIQTTVQTYEQIVQFYAQTPRNFMGEKNSFFPLDSMKSAQRYARTYSFCRFGHNFALRA